MPTIFDKKLSLEKGMYQESRDKGMPFNIWLEKHLVEQYGMEPTVYEKQNMSNYDKFMYRRSLKKAGQEIPLDAYEIALKSFGIRAFGTHTDTVEKFFISPDTTVLFPEFIQNRVYASAMRAARWPELVAETVTISGLDYRKIMLQDEEADRQTARVGRGGEFPRKRFEVAKQLVHLEKYGMNLEIDYEALYNTPLNVFAVVLDRVGMQIGIDETDDLIYQLVNGDGNSNGLSGTYTKTTATTGVITKLDIITFKAALAQPYELNKFVGPLAYMIKYWDALSDMTNPSAQWGATGMTLPQGFEWDRGTVNTTGDRFFGVDSRYAAGYVTNDSVMMTETDRIISKQKVETVVSKRGTFNILDQLAIGALDIEH